MVCQSSCQSLLLGGMDCVGFGALFTADDGTTTRSDANRQKTTVLLVAVESRRLKLLRSELSLKLKQNNTDKRRMVNGSGSLLLARW